MEPQRALFVLALLAGCAGAPGPTPRVPAAPPPVSLESDGYFGASVDYGDVWTETSREELRVGGVDVVLVGRSWPGEGAALFVMTPDGRPLGAYQFAFGGNGGELAIARRCVTPDWVVLELRAEGFARGFRLDPGEGACPASIDAARSRAIDDGAEEDPCEVPSSSEVSFAEIGVDATRVWLVSALSSTEPERTCYAPQ